MFYVDVNIFTWKYIVSVSRARWRRRPAPKKGISNFIIEENMVCWIRLFWKKTFKKSDCHSTKTTLILFNHPLNAVHLCDIKWLLWLVMSNTKPNIWPHCLHLKCSQTGKNSLTSMTSVAISLSQSCLTIVVYSDLKLDISLLKDCKGLERWHRFFELIYYNWSNFSFSLNSADCT